MDYLSAISNQPKIENNSPESSVGESQDTIDSSLSDAHEDSTIASTQVIENPSTNKQEVINTSVQPQDYEVQKTTNNAENNYADLIPPPSETSENSSEIPGIEKFIQIQPELQKLY